MYQLHTVSTSSKFKMEQETLIPCFNLMKSFLEENGAATTYHKKSLSYFSLDVARKEPIHQGIEVAESGGTELLPLP